MKKVVRIGFPILCVVVVGGSLIALNDISKKAEFIKEQREKKAASNTSIVNEYDSNNSYIENDANTTGTKNTIKNNVVYSMPVNGGDYNE